MTFSLRNSFKNSDETLSALCQLWNQTVNEVKFTAFHWHFTIQLTCNVFQLTCIVCFHTNLAFDQQSWTCILPPKVFSLLFQFWGRCSREHSLQNALREVNFFQLSVLLSPQQFTQCPRQRYFTFMCQLWVRRRQGFPLFCVNCDGDAISIDPAHKMGWVGQRHISPKNMNLVE